MSESTPRDGLVASPDPGPAPAPVAGHLVRDAIEAGALQQTARVMDAMGVGYAALDADWRYLVVNQSAAAVGMSRAEDLVGRVMWDCYPAMVGSEFDRRYRRALQTGRAEVFESDYPEPLDISVQVTAVPRPQPAAAPSPGVGAASCVLELMFTDVTARRAAQLQADLASARQRVLTSLGQTALGLADADDLPALARVISGPELATLGCDGGTLTIRDRTSGALVDIAPLPSTGLDSPVPSRIDVDGSRRPGLDQLPRTGAAAELLRHAIESGEPVLLPGPTAGDEGSARGGAVAHVPLRSEGRVLGVLTARWPRPQPFDAEQLQLLQTFTAQCGQALGRLLAREHERVAAHTARTAAGQQASLVSIAHELAAADSQDDVLRVLAEEGRELMAANGCGLCLRDPDGEHVSTLITDGYADVRTVVQRVPADFPLPAIASAAYGRVFFLSDRTQTESLFPGAGEVYDGAGVEASAALPLRARGRLLGCLSIGFAETRAWTEQDRDLLTAFAALTAQALDRLAALQAEHAATRRAQRAAVQQSALNHIASALLQAGDETDVLRVVSRDGAALLGAAGAGLALVEPDGSHVRVMTTDYFSDQLQQDIARLPSTTALPIVRAAIDGTAFYLPDRAAAEAAYPGCEALYAAADTEGSAEVPLRTGRGLLGTLSVAFSAPHDWQQDEKSLLEAFAVLTAQTLERIQARTAEQAASAAVARFSETMQRSLLTRPPAVDHLRMAVRYVPAAAEAYVGGDWYDAFLAAEGTLNLVIGDVVGHDRTAAAAMAQLRNVLRGVGYTLDRSPSAVLTALDRAAVGLQVGGLATVLLARIEQDEAQRAAGVSVLRWSSAGHPPPLLITAAGEVRHLSGRPDLLIGVNPDVRRNDHEQLLGAGDTVLLFTDGLVERRGADLDEGLAWLAAAARNLAECDLETLCDTLLAHVEGHAGDDVALLALRPEEVAHR